ncbi:MAG: pilin [Patescibacteria group bacterium]
MQKSYFLLIVTILIIFLVPVFIVNAQLSGTNPPTTNISGQNPPSANISGQNPPAVIKSVELPNPLGTTSISDLLKKIIDWIIELGAPVAVIMVVFGAFKMLFSGGDPEKFASGRKTILYTVMGYGIIFLAWSIASLIENILKS